MFGTFIEELISPIPSFMVLIPTGAAAQVRNLSIWYLLVLMIFSGVGRIAGAIILYWIAGRAEGALLKRKRKIFNISQRQIERVGRRLGRNNWRDWATLFILNAIPIFPTAGLAFICGFLKVNFRMFFVCTFFGTMINALIFMLIGYVGAHTAATIQTIRFTFQIVIAVVVAIAVVALLVRRQAKSRT